MSPDPTHERQIHQLKDALQRQWWLVAAGLWLVIGSLSLWALRHEFDRLKQYFTWTAVRYGLAYHRPAAIGLGLCVGVTLALLVAESRHILFGLTRGERHRLERQLQKIRQQGPSHPLWRHISQDEGEV